VIGEFVKDVKIAMRSPAATTIEPAGAQVRGRLALPVIKHARLEPTPLVSFFLRSH
jgi:hypothetical protein